MKKILLSIALLGGLFMTGNAKELTFIYNDAPVANGGVVEFFDYETYPGEIFINPEIYLESDIDATVTLKSVANYPVQICIGGQCEADEYVYKDDLNFKGGVPQDVLLDCSLYGDVDEIVIPSIEVQLEAWYNDDPSTVYSITVKMGDWAAIKSISGDSSKVNFDGRNLNYDLGSASTISLYSLSGKTILSKNVAGSGSINLNGLSKGVYLYRIAGKNGKTVKSSKIIVK